MSMQIPMVNFSRGESDINTEASEFATSVQFVKDQMTQSLNVLFGIKCSELNFLASSSALTISADLQGVVNRGVISIMFTGTRRTRTCFSHSYS